MNHPIAYYQTQLVYPSLIDSVIGSVMIDAEFDREDYSSIPATVKAKKSLDVKTDPQIILN
jgi:hypothetical protein